MKARYHCIGCGTTFRAEVRDPYEEDPDCPNRCEDKFGNTGTLSVPWTQHATPEAVQQSFRSLMAWPWPAAHRKSIRRFWRANRRWLMRQAR